MIEGSQLYTDTYCKLKEAGYISKDLKETDCLITAYEYATTHAISESHILKAHKIMSQTLSIDDKYKG